MIHYTQKGSLTGLLKSCKTLILFVDSFINHHRDPKLYGVPNLQEAQNETTIANIHYRATMEMIKMSETLVLTPGLIWVRQIFSTHYGRTEYSRWAIARIEGKYPFMKAKIVLVPETDDGKDPTTHVINDMAHWQFGPILNIPNEHYVEDTKK